MNGNAPRPDAETRTAAIEVMGLSKRFGRVRAVEDVDIRVEPGEMVGLLGHNGAGKSTTLGCLLGQCFADRGELRVFGHDVTSDRRRALRRIGAIFETPCFYGYLSGMQNLYALVRLTGPVSRDRLDAIVARVGLTDRIHDRVDCYSHGMRQRLALAQALLPEPGVLILDEPGDGLDPAGIVEIREMIRTLHRQLNLTVLLASHQLIEVEQLCERVVVFDHGRKIFDGAWREAAGFDRLVQLVVDRPLAALAHARTAGLVEDEAPSPPSLDVRRWKLAKHVTPAALNRGLLHAGFEVHEIAPVRPRLEDLYLNLRQRESVAAPEPLASIAAAAAT
mgnify:CR=1 FL=1